jgi:phage terminase large subunit-like protein
MAARHRVISPQPGPQHEFAANSADWCIFAGAPGSGKSWANCLELLRWHHLPNYFAIGFRPQANELTGGASSLYSTIRRLAAGSPSAVRSPVPELRWNNGAVVQLRHSNTDPADFDGTEIALSVYDELQRFDREFFEYVSISRGRTTCGLRSYMRASAMPTPGVWLADLVRPWLHEDGTQDFAQSGRIRWFIRNKQDVPVFFDAEGDARDAAKVLDTSPISLSFVFARTADNVALMEADPEYQVKLSRLDPITRRRFVELNWLAHEGPGQYFNPALWAIYDEWPCPVIASVRGWDRAATEPHEGNRDPDYTRGVRVDVLSNGQVGPGDVVSRRAGPGPVRELICQTARIDGPAVTQAFWIDPGSAGKDEEATIRAHLAAVPGCGPCVFMTQGAERNTATYLRGLSAFANRVPGSHTPGFGVLRRGWTSELTHELRMFPDPKTHDDIASALARAWVEVKQHIRSEMAGIDPWSHSFMKSLSVT